jgi:hypothetical protein
LSNTFKPVRGKVANDEAIEMLVGSGHLMAADTPPVPWSEKGIYRHENIQNDAYTFQQK